MKEFQKEENFGPKTILKGKSLSTQCKKHGHSVTEGWIFNEWCPSCTPRSCGAGEIAPSFNQGFESQEEKAEMPRCQERGMFSSGQSEEDAKQRLQHREGLAHGEEGTWTHDHRAEI